MIAVFRCGAQDDYNEIKELGGTSEVVKIQRFEPPTFVAGFLGTGGVEGTFALSRGTPNLPSYHRCSVGGLRLKINGVLFIL